MTENQPLGPKDFASATEIRWCPGCGNFAIIKAVQAVLAESGARPEDTAFISGIGCSSRFPYYMETYGFHTIHGRAAAVATGVKLANPALDVWVVSGDGDSLAIGGNHLFHLLRRDVDLTYLLLNNEIYGLTKGQASPTSRIGQKTPTSPAGTPDRPADPVAFALGSGATFIARAVDTVRPLMTETIGRARRHPGTGFVEILQNCLVFNDGAFAPFEDKKQIAEKLLSLAHGEPMLFGAERDKGLGRDPVTGAPVIVPENAADDPRTLVHDETDTGLAFLLAGLDRTRFPLPVGVIHAAPATPFMDRQSVIEAKPAARRSALAAALQGTETWTVGG